MTHVYSCICLVLCGQYLYPQYRPCICAQICQYLSNGKNVNIAPPLSEAMWIEEDGTPYVYYPNPDNEKR